MTSEGKRVDWEGGNGGWQDGGRESENGSRRKEEKIKNPGNLSESETERSEAEKSGSEENSVEEACRTALDGVMAKAKEDGGLMSEIMEKVALVGMAEWGNRLEYFGDTMPKGISSANREIWVLSVKWMVEKRLERNEEMKKRREIDGDDKSFMRRVGGMKCLTFGMHHGKTFREVYLSDPGYCGSTVGQDRPMMWKLKCFKYFVVEND